MGVHRPANPVTDAGDYAPRQNGGFGYVHPKGNDVISFSPTSYTVNPSALTVGVTVVRQGLHSDAISCQYTTAVGTTGTVAWAAGDLAPKTITLNLFAETLNWRQFLVTLSNPVRAELLNSVATVDVTPTYLTSQLYPIEVIEAMGLPNAVITSMQEFKIVTEAMEMPGAVLVLGILSVDASYSTNTMKAEAFDMPHAVIVSGALEASAIFTTTTMKAEAFDMPHASLIAGSMVVELITYSNYPAEAFDMPNASLVSGSLE